MLGIRLRKTSKDRLYDTSDALLAHHKTIEKKLRAREADLFSLSRSVVLYDVTNTHFEGLCEKNPKARHGKNKQKRNDCRQVALGMAFDEHGLPLAHEVFEGMQRRGGAPAVRFPPISHSRRGGRRPASVFPARRAANVPKMPQYSPWRTSEDPR
jgi:hypothetical protein